MWTMQNILNLIYMFVALALGLFLLWRWWRHLSVAKRRDDGRPAELFGDLQTLFSQSQVGHGESHGTWKLRGNYAGRHFQVTVLADNLAPRKLPGLWLMVTRPGELPVSHVLDMMMRPAGPTSFSNFDFLAETLPTPANFPAHAVLRSDQARAPLPTGLLTPHLELFLSGKGKELLISPKGIRIVTLLAEADRARYGVMRQADFGNARPSQTLVQAICDCLIALEDDIRNWAKEQSPEQSHA